MVSFLSSVCVCSSKGESKEQRGAIRMERKIEGDFLSGRLKGHEFEQTHGDGGGQRSLACCSPQCKESV